MFSNRNSSFIHSEPHLQDEIVTPLHDQAGGVQRMRRDSQFRAVAHTMNNTISGRYIRTWSVWFLVTLAVHIALCVAIAGQDLRKNLHLANSPLAKLNYFSVTFIIVTLPLTCRHFLNILAGAVAGLLLTRRGYPVASVSLLLAVNLRLGPSLHQYATLFRSVEKGVRSILLIRLTGDYIVCFAVPFVSLALLVRSEKDRCWMGYHWTWLLFALLWPTTWSLVIIIYMIGYWGSQECIRAGPPTGISATLQAALDLALVLRDADGNATQFSGNWKYGHQIIQREGYMGVDQSFLGLIKEEECLSLTDMLLALE